MADVALPPQVPLASEGPPAHAKYYYGCSNQEELQIERLRKELKITTKSGLIRAALKALEKKTEDERLRREIQESGRRCADADREENREIFPAGVARRAVKG